MAHWMARGLTGLRLFTTGSTMPGQAGWLDDPRTFPAWRKAEETGLPVCLQMTAEGIPQLENVLAAVSAACASSSITLHVRSRMTDLLTRAPTVCGGSRGFPACTSRSRNVTSSARPKGRATPETFFGRLVSEFGASRIAWGSNFPASERSLPELSRSRRTRFASCRRPIGEWIFSRTAQTLYPALASQQ